MATNNEKPTYLTDEIWSKMSEEEKNSLLKNTKKPRAKKEIEIKYLENEKIANTEDCYKLTNYDEYKKFVLKDADLLKDILTSAFKSKKSNCFKKEKLIIKSAPRGENKEENGEVGKNTALKVFGILNPTYRCPCSTKNGRCPYLAEKESGECLRCFKQGKNGNTEVNPVKIKDEFKKFRAEYKSKPNELLEILNEAPKNEAPKEPPKEDEVLIKVKSPKKKTSKKK
jgi:hypothetical protein